MPNDKPELPDMTKHGGYNIFSMQESGGFAAWNDDGPVSPVFSTKEEAIAWAIENPKGGSDD
ncbi:hypothetical protein [Phyllobacterium sp. K27]